MITSRFEKALRRATEWHQDQVRKGSSLPYISHPFGVALILDRLGFSEEVVIAGLLHDVVEDAEISLQTIELEFGHHVRHLVALMSEQKLDGSGNKRPWVDRKREFLATMAAAPAEARAIALADKLHNLMSIHVDLAAGRDVWSLFNADRAAVLSNYAASIDAFGYEDERVVHLANECRTLLHGLRVDSESQSEVGR